MVVSDEKCDQRLYMREALDRCSLRGRTINLAPNLIGSLMAQVYRLLGIDKKQTMAYSSKSLGKHERFHRTMAASIRCLLLGLKDVGVEWDAVLPMVEFAYRTSVCPETSLSPMDVWLGREVRMPVNLTLNPTDVATPSSPEAYALNVRKRLKLMYEIQADQEKVARENMIEKYNEKSRPVVYVEGDLVYVNEPCLHDEKTRKLSPQWKGPFLVTEVASGHSLKLRDLITKKDLPSLTHVDRVKRCWSDPEFFLGQQPSVVAPDVPVAIVEQKGQRYLVRHQPPGSHVAAPARNKWMRLSDIPESLVEEWRRLHRKDGGARVRRLHPDGEPPPTRESVESNDRVSDNNAPLVVSYQAPPNQNSVKLVPPTKDSDVARNDVPVGIRRSPRNLPRVNYSEFDSHGFY